MKEQHKNRNKEMLKGLLNQIDVYFIAHIQQYR